LTTAFIDTGAWIALLVPRDNHHRRARAFFQRIAPRTRLLTSNYVLAETVTWLAYHGLRSAALRLKEQVSAAESTSLLATAWVTPDVHDAAWDYFERFDSQDFSFCDCTSFALCRARKVDFVFGFDHRFRSMGFDLQPGP
jgi:hypothetical protein